MRIRWWAWLLTFDAVGWLFITTVIFLTQLMRSNVLEAFSNAKFFEMPSYFPWYVWIAVGHAAICGFFVVIRGLPEQTIGVK